MHSVGHEVVVMGMAHDGDPHSFPYPIYPCVSLADNAQSYGGETRLASMIARVRPDVVVLLNDGWNYPRYFECLDEVKAICDRDGIVFDIPPIVGWVAADSRNQKSEQLDRLSHVMVWVDFARQEFQKSIDARIETANKNIEAAKLTGSECAVASERAELVKIYHGGFDIVPLGVDTDLFRPLDRSQCRTDIGLIESGIPADAFIVGVVGRNQMRKRLELSLCYFAEWLRRDNVTDAYLYLHVAPTGERSADIKSLVRFYGLGGRVIVNAPNVGVGDDDFVMPLIYNSFDVYMTQSQGEGFGLPALEALACGIVPVLPDHSAFGPAGWIDSSLITLPKVSCSVDVLTAPLSARPYTIGSLPDCESTVNLLSSLYHCKIARERFRESGPRLAQTLTWKRTGELFVESLERFFVRHQEAVVQRKSEKAKTVDVCITVLNRYDLLRRCLESLCKAGNVGSVYIIDNGTNADQMDRVTAGLSLNVSVLNSHRLGLAKSWNTFIEATKETRIITNDDIEFTPDSIQKLLASKADIAFPKGIGFSCFLLRDSCVAAVGRFDEELSPGFAYFEDCDYMNRIEVYNKENPETPLIAQDISEHGIVHINHGTQKALQADKVLEFRRLYWLAQERFIVKWGTLSKGLRRMERSEWDVSAETETEVVEVLANG